MWLDKTKCYKLHLLTRCAERLCLARTFSRFILWDWRPHKSEPPLPRSHQNYLIGATDLILRCCCEAASKALRLYWLAVDHQFSWIFEHFKESKADWFMMIWGWSYTYSFSVISLKFKCRVAFGQWVNGSKCDGVFFPKIRQPYLTTSKKSKTWSRNPHTMGKKNVNPADAHSKCH